MHNPALYHAGRLTRFQTNFSGTRTRIQSGGAEESLSSASFDSWGLGFPLLWRQLHVGLGFTPISQVDYLLAQSGVDALGRVQLQSLKGRGGLSRAGLTIASPTPAPTLRAGLELGLVFGSVLEEWKNFYPQSAPPYDSWVNTRHSLFGFQTRLGLHWQARPDLALGLVWTPPSTADLTVDRENKGNDQDAELPIRRVDLPAEHSLGLAWRKGGVDWLLDLRLQDWSGVPMGSVAAERQGRVDHPIGLALGLDLPLSREFAAPWYRRLTWRAGMRWQEWYARREQADGSWRDVETVTLSLGAGVPLKAHGSWLDLALEAGRSGDTVLDEDFVRLRMGFGARDLWFLRPVY
jgi:hypothetical protein